MASMCVLKLYINVFKQALTRMSHMGLTLSTTSKLRLLEEVRREVLSTDGNINM